MQKAVLREKFRVLGWRYAAAIFISSMAWANTFCLLLSPHSFMSADYMAALRPGVFLTVLTVSFALVAAATLLFGAFVAAYNLAISVTLCAMVMAGISLGGIWFYLGLAAVLFYTAYWLAQQDKLWLSVLAPFITYKQVKYFVIGLFILFTAVVSYFSILRYLAYGSSAFDFGVFTQMFEQMRRTGLPVTTVERNMLLSHFGVHFSPVYYLLLPAYILFPHPICLLIMQAAAVGGGVFAVYLICRHFKLSPALTAVMALLYVLLPSNAAGCMWDFHENKLLTVLLLFTIFFMLKRKAVWTFVFALLVLTVKEDAAIYIAALALYMVFARHERLRGGLLAALAVVYFVFAVNMVAYFGDGVMVDRLKNYYYADQAGFGAVAKTVFFNVGYLVGQVFTTDKLAFVLWMLLPVGGLPLAGRRIDTLLLLLPMLVVNLMPNYIYQYNYMFQYTFGAAALVLFATILTVRQLRGVALRTFAIGAVCVSLTLCATGAGGRFGGAYNSYHINADRIAAVDALIKTIPADVRVAATTFFIPHLYYVDDLYVIPNTPASVYNPEAPELFNADIYIINRESAEAAYALRYIPDGYIKIAGAEFCEIYARP